MAKCPSGVSSSELLKKLMLSFMLLLWLLQPFQSPQFCASLARKRRKERKRKGKSVQRLTSAEMRKERGEMWLVRAPRFQVLIRRFFFSSNPLFLISWFFFHVFICFFFLLYFKSLRDGYLIKWCLVLIFLIAFGQSVVHVVLHLIV